jgi:dihydrofolate synthase/folylpolyglutamate synthase
MADKDYRAMFGRIIPMARRIFAVSPDNPRALGAEELAGYFMAQGVKNVSACGSIEQGMRAALDAVSAEDVVCAFGSFYMAGAIRKMFV